MLGLVTVVYNQAEATQRLITSVDYYPRQIHLFLHSQRPEVIEACRQIARRPDVVYYPYGNNPGLAQSWNEGIYNARRAGCSPVLVVNNDIEFGPGSISAMIGAARENQDRYLITCGHGFSCFIIQPIALETIGYFDEAIRPAYYEDCDYARRAHLAGLEGLDLPDLDVRHIGNGTIRSERRSYKRKYRHDLARLKTYYRAKWGGGPLMEPSIEIYKRPFKTGELYHGYQNN